MIARRQLLGATLPALAACNRKHRHTIAVVPKATSHLFFVSVHAGVSDAARDFAVEILWNGPREETEHTRQIQIVDSMLARKVDALAISATDERALAGAVARVIRAGIPVSIFDSGVNVEGYVSYIATDNYGAGCEAARRMANLIGGRGLIGMVMHKPGGTSTTLRERGFIETIATVFPNVTIAAKQFGNADPARSRAAAENILTANPDLSGIFASSEASSLGAIQAIKTRELSSKIRLITFDNSRSHVEALKDGTVDLMFVQDAHKLGYEAVKSLVQKLRGETPPKRLDIIARVIAKADLADPQVRSLLTSPRPET